MTTEITTGLLIEVNARHNKTDKYRETGTEIEKNTDKVRDSFIAWV